MPAQPRIAIDDARRLRALAHPLRLRILAMLQERPASPVQLAPRLGSTLGRVSHHVRVLRDNGMIELVETHKRRGAIEHVYAAPEIPRFSDRAWRSASAGLRRQVAGAALAQIADYVAAAAAGGGFDRPDANLSRVPLRLDDEGWRELAEAGRRWLEEADAIHARAAARGGEAHDVGLVLLLFDALTFSDQPPPKD